MQSKFAEVNGIRLHYLTAGEGDPVVLLHGYAQTSHMWLPLIAKLAGKHKVIAPDLRGFGQSFGVGATAKNVLPFFSSGPDESQ